MKVQFLYLLSFILVFGMVACTPPKPHNDSGKAAGKETLVTDSVKLQLEAKKNQQATDSIAEAIWIKK